jgi:pyridoxal phosphate enzyme (YggS family)
MPPHDLPAAEAAVTARLTAVREGVRQAAERAGRAPAEIRLVGASKTVPADHLIAVVRAGLVDLGENRVQEAEAKAPAVRAGLAAVAGAQASPTWHLIGHLQSNKARRAVALFDWIQSLDSPDLADALDRIAGEIGRASVPVLVEVNVAGEASKAGVAPADAAALVAHAARLPRLEVRGLMTVGPLVATPAEARPAFARMRALLAEARQAVEAQRGIAIDVAARLDQLSMGMSGDFEVAIEEGATMVRVGGALFGARPA